MVGKAGKGSLEHRTPPLFYTQQVCCTGSPKGKQSGDQVAVVGLGSLGPESAHSRGWCCPSPSGRLTQPDKPQAPCLRRRAGGCKNETPPELERDGAPGRSAQLPGCGAASRFPGACSPPSRPLVNLSAGKAPLPGAEANRPPPPALRSGPGRSLTNLSSSWLLLESRALALRARIGRLTLLGVLSGTGRHGQEGRRLPSTSFSKKPSLPPRLGLLHQELQSRGGMWGAGRGKGLGFEEGIL